MSVELVRSLIRDVPDFPSPGILFKDITPLLADPKGFASAVDLMSEQIRPYDPHGLIAIESRGFIFCAALATSMGLPMHLIRKPGKLPHSKAGLDYDLEYGSDRLEIHLDAVKPGGRYAVVDDVLATGGTAAAAASLVEQQQGEVSCCAFLMELSFLDGRSKLVNRPAESLVIY
ncbi:MAG: adenine phosphoribosyltransferase [Pseudomonadota bacterium]